MIENPTSVGFFKNKNKILKYIREKEFPSSHLNDIEKVIFTSKRNKLTKTGHEILQKYFEFYSVKMPEGFKLLSRYNLFLIRHSTYPWYYDGESKEKFLVLYDGDMAVFLQMCDGDIDQTMKSFS
ncbi:MAG: hypothetical protein WC284_03805 [Candidimonas sp.]